MKRSNCASGRGYVPLLFHGVLRGHHDKRLGQLDGAVAHRHLVLLHRFQQGRLRLGRGTVDLVGQDEVSYHRSVLEHQLVSAAFLFVQHHRAHDVGRHKIGRELNPGEFELQGRRQRTRQQRLADTRHPFQQRMTVAQQRRQQRLDNLVVPHEDLLHLLLQPRKHLDEAVHLCLGHAGVRWFSCVC